MKRYLSFGSGKRPLVIIPGLSLVDVTAGGALLKVIFKQFTDDWTVYVIDRPESVEEGTTNADLARDYMSLMMSLGISNADIIGVSQGGMIAQHIAVERPEMVHKLVLGATLSRSNANAETVIARWIQLAEERQWYELNKDIFQKLYTEEYLKKNRLAVEIVAKAQKPSDPERFIKLAKACRSAGPFGELGRIRCPVLVMGGENDLVVTAEGSREIADAIEGSELFMFSGLGHAIYDESKDFYNKAREFLARQG